MSESLGHRRSAFDRTVARSQQGGEAQDICTGAYMVEPHPSFHNPGLPVRVVPLL